jgi:hypothetical protein
MNKLAVVSQVAGFADLNKMSPAYQHTAFLTSAALNHNYFEWQRGALGAFPVWFQLHIRYVCPYLKAFCNSFSLGKPANCGLFL